MPLFKNKLTWFLLGMASGILAVAAGGFLVLSSPTLRTHLKNTVKKLMKVHQTVAAIKTLEAKSKDLLHPGLVIPDNFLHYPFPGSRVEKNGDLTTWIAPLSDRIQLQDVPPSSLIGKPGSSSAIHLIGLRGEVLSFQLVLRSSRKIPDLHAELSTASDPKAFSCITTHRFLEHYEHFTASDVKYGPIHPHDIPDPLIPFRDPYTPGRIIVADIPVTPDANQPVWIDIAYAKNCSPGTYTGVLTVRSGAQILRKTPVNFEVLAPVLPEHAPISRWMELYVSRFYGGLVKGGLPTSDLEFQRMYRRAFVLAHAYGFSTNDSGGIHPDIRWDWRTGTPTSVDWSGYDQLYGPMLSGELTGSPPNTWSLPIGTWSLGIGMWGGFAVLGGNPSPVSDWKGVPDIATQNLAKLIVQHWKEKGWPIDKTFAYIADEPVHKLYYYADTYKLIAKNADSLHKGSPHIHVMVTDVPYITYKNQVGHNKLIMVGKVNIWAGASAQFIPSRMQERQKEGDHVWFYQAGGPPFIGQNDLYSLGPGFRMWFWTAWKYHVNGVFYWADTFWNDNKPNMNPYVNQGLGDGTIMYPGTELHFIGYPDIHGPIPSIRMAQWRRGYEDYRYLTYLKQMHKEKEADRIVDKLVIHALDDGGYLPYWRSPLWQKPGDWSHNPQDWHRERIKMAREIAAIPEN
ncbi:DUF4091 domain-containing protein [Leptospirillum ferriphilum]|uniref:Glycoside hydrolase 123 catalytic domain-containing protein n=1 Tax=Leptospirillum ferriphilum YSK TaxID=1441628 RepID=A0A059XXA2_9BACT|nr:DUF4091 domain-containing protein [Leptospirillum ferriphilum]AIA31538.1 hypothetical protein Y981_03210 [Leptospirillum ferriphilum YSK]